MHTSAVGVPVKATLIKYRRRHDDGKAHPLCPQTFGPSPRRTASLPSPTGL
jgi:hypothetical protein